MTVRERNEFLQNLNKNWSTKSNEVNLVHINSTQKKSFYQISRREDEPWSIKLYLSRAIFELANFLVVSSDALHETLFTTFHSE